MFALSPMWYCYLYLSSPLYVTMPSLVDVHSVSSNPLCDSQSDFTKVNIVTLIYCSRINFWFLNKCSIRPKLSRPETGSGWKYLGCASEGELKRHRERREGSQASQITPWNSSWSWALICFLNAVKVASSVWLCKTMDYLNSWKSSGHRMLLFFQGIQLHLVVSRDGGGQPMKETWHIEGALTTVTGRLCIAGADSNGDLLTMIAERRPALVRQWGVEREMQSGESSQFSRQIGRANRFMPFPILSAI